MWCLFLKYFLFPLKRSLSFHYLFIIILCVSKCVDFLYFNFIYLCYLTESFCCLSPIFIRLSQSDCTLPTPLKLDFCGTGDFQLLRPVVIDSALFTWFVSRVGFSCVSSPLWNSLSLLWGTAGSCFAHFPQSPLLAFLLSLGLPRCQSLALFCFVFTCFWALGYGLKYQIHAGKSPVSVSSPDLVTGLQTCLSSLQ